MRTNSQFDPIFGQALRAGIDDANADGNGKSDGGDDISHRGLLYDGWSYRPLPPTRGDRQSLSPSAAR